VSCPRCNGPAEEQTLREFGGVCPKCLLAFSAEQDAPAFPNLEIVEMIGQGGMGVVYKARQKNLDRVVALKVLSPQLSEDPEFVERFTREAKALAQLSHPGIVAIHDSGIHDRVPYLVMEYIDGQPLRSLLASGKITPARALEFIPQICDALQYAHAHGVVHRDIKPENILIDRQGRVKIADFGLAKLSKVEETRITQSGYVMGTPRYMAPEQFQASGKVDHRADIYSLGVVFYEMLTGEVPMGRFKPPSEKADVDRRLDPVVLKSLEREPDDRWQSAGEVKENISHLEKADPPPARPPMPVKRTNWAAAGCIIVLIFGAAGVLVVVLGLFLVTGSAEAPHAATVTAPIQPPPEGRRRSTINDLWTPVERLPAGFEGTVSFDGQELPKDLGIPMEIVKDVELIRGLDFQRGKAVMIGFQFKTELAWRRWREDPALRKVIENWHYNQAGPGLCLLLIRHDGSPIGKAAKDMLETLVKGKLDQPRNR
jgi:tRNA A-37 threonylcarbamoyl transferase component Bud32